MKTFLLVVCVAIVASACSSSDDALPNHDTPEHAVVAWFDAIDAGDAEAASASIHPHSLAIILGTENSLSVDAITEYLEAGVPIEVQEGYWKSFAEGFSDFASRPVSTLTVGEATPFTSEGNEFARVPVSGGETADSVVIARMLPDGSWEVDMVATLGDGFVKVLRGAYDALPADVVADRIRDAYRETVVPGLWAAMAEGDFGDDFARSALALIEAVEAVEANS